MALLYDLFIIVAISMAYSALVTFALEMSNQGAPTENYQPMHQGYWFLAGWQLCIAAFYWFFWIRAGQTVGMKAWRLKLVSADGAPLSHRQCLIRVFVAPLSILLGGLGFLWSLFGPDRKTWHDLASNTRVIVLPKPTR